MPSAVIELTDRFRMCITRLRFLMLARSAATCRQCVIVVTLQFYLSLVTGWIQTQVWSRMSSWALAASGALSHLSWFFTFIALLSRLLTRFMHPRQRSIWTRLPSVCVCVWCARGSLQKINIAPEKKKKGQLRLICQTTWQLGKVNMPHILTSAV